ncbi:hypothetical protein [Flavihumibacter profundi]|uniref:hypothetical protein n=1 Tax=Flavihumibacter profundi TaxID=2716883 RepID=UPI001CC6AEB2|nr:hypothetical protein [Flavihumibacter profundi]MBZ5856819.1 hypothetical protein [Flavihumibacter profundi]
MKYLITLVCFGVTIVLLEGCKKDSAKNIDNSSSIIGDWELRQIFAQIGMVNYPSGNGSILKFTDSTWSTTDTAWSIFVRGNHHANGYYRIVADTSVNNSTGLGFPSGQFTNRIILEGDTTSDKIFYQVTNSKLVIVSGYFPLDGGIEMTYVRK